ncbi:MAG: DUF4476 domain-containing protein [Terrimonas sp.]|nr:DUF4476 domain-containing protein [Terrimonas sp.]
MKKIYILLLTLFFGAAVFAADTRPVMTTLTIQSSDHDDIKVMIDGKRFDPRFNTMMLENLRPGQHQVKVFKQKDRLFKLFGHPHYDLVYNSSIIVRPGTHTLITLDRFNRSRVEVRKVYQDQRFKGKGASKGRYDDSKDRDVRNHEYDFDRDGRMGNMDDNEWYDDVYDGSGRGGAYGHEDASFYRPMNDYAFSQAIQTIGREWFEADKLKKAEDIISTNRMSSSQVKQVVQLFSFENNKLALAKFAYANTVDKQNYYIMNDVFSFNSSKKELDNYIRRVH